MNCIKPGQTISPQLLVEKTSATIFSKCKKCDYEYEHHMPQILTEVTKALPKCPRTVDFQLPCDNNGCKSMTGIVLSQVIE